MIRRPNVLTSPNVLTYDSGMTTTAAQATATITLAAEAGRVAVLIDGFQIGTVKDGGHIITNVEHLLTRCGVRRLSGYSLNADRDLTATAVA